MNSFAVLVILAVPAIFAILRAKDIAVSAFAYNAEKNSLLRVSASAVCGNVGVGTFVVYYLLTRASPVIGISAALAGMIGLLLCAVLARRLHALSRRTGTYGLVDLIVATHGVTRPLFIWVPVAVVFMMRILVQLSALALILSEFLEISFLAALILGTLVSSLYVIAGGYKAATETDLFHAAVIVVLSVLAFAALPPFEAAERAFLDLGPYSPAILVGIFLFLPFSTIMGIDNWQRIATAHSPSVAANAYLIATAICGFVYLLVVATALLPDAQDDVLTAFRGLMPLGAPWLADILIVSAIVSSVDTFSVPLVSTFARQGLSLARLRLVIAGIFTVVAIAAALLGDILAGVIAAFNSLAVFLPAVIGAIALRNPRAEAAIASMGIGVIAVLCLSAMDQNSAAPVGFLLSTLIYWRVNRKYSRPLL